MKNALLTIILFTGYLLSAQDQAPLEVTVLDFDSNPIVKDKVSFIGINSKFSIAGITGQDGKFVVKLPPGDTYEIQIDALGSELDYSTVEVPELPEGASFQQMEMEIMYETPTVITLENLQFDTGRATIKSSGFTSLNKLADYLKRKSSTSIRIEGHTDNEGADDSNLNLSEARAFRVKKYLVSKGVKESNIETVGHGEAKPIADNSTAEGRAKNRRTEIHVL